MPKARFAVLIMALLILPLLAVVVTMPIAVTAQDLEAGTPPRVITPGQPLFGITGGQPTLDFTECYDPLPVEIGGVIFIEPGVNIRSGPSGSSALVWNTIYNNLDEEGLVVDDPVRIIATVVGGPVCDKGYNWWQVELPGNDGWVAEGRPGDVGGYLFFVAGMFEDRTCRSLYELHIGQFADLLLDARVRTEPNLNGRVRTVAPAGTPVLVVGGPQCVDQIKWWLVRVEVVDFVYEGWMAEGAEGLTWLYPQDLPSTADGTLCGAPLGLPIGQRAYVHSLEEVPRNLRAAPGLDGPLMFILVDGTPFIVEGGPVCRNNLNWWQIRVLSSRPVIGWMAEGSQGVGYWISTINPNEFAR